MGIFDRLSTMLRSNINDLISRAENPEKMLNQLIVDMKTQLAKAKQQVASAIADEKKLQSDVEAMKKQADDWERRAMMAVQEGRDDLAKQALGRYNEHLQGAHQLQETWMRLKAETDQLKLSLRQLNEKIEATERKALAAAELNEEVSGDRLARQFEALEYKGSSDQQLLELKSKMGILGAGRPQGSKQIGTGREDVRDAELIEEGDEGKKAR